LCAWCDAFAKFIRVLLSQESSAEKRQRISAATIKAIERRKTLYPFVNVIVVVRKKFCFGATLKRITVQPDKRVWLMKSFLKT